MRSLTLVALALAACAHQDLPLHDARGQDRALLVTDARAAHEHSLREEAIEVPFGQRESGTRLVLALMHLAESRGAAYVSDLEFLQVFRYKGELVECSTRVASAAEVERARAPAPAAAPVAPAAPPSADEPPTYETSVSAPQPEAIDVKVAEDVVKCERHGEMQMVKQPQYASRFDVEQGESLDGRPMPVELIMKVRWRDQCHTEHVVHDVRRWDFQVKLEWQPPDWALIARSWAQDPIADATPRCYRTTTAQIGDPPRHRMRAKLYYRSNFRDAGKWPF